MVVGLKNSIAIEIEIDAGKPRAGTWPRIPIVLGCRRVSQMFTVAHRRLDCLALRTALRIWFGVGFAGVRAGAGAGITATRANRITLVAKRVSTAPGILAVG